MWRSIFFVGILSLCSLCVFANQADTAQVATVQTESSESTAQKKFDPVRMIFDHISDSHEWHIFSLGETHVTLPLPIIVYSRVRKEWFCFLSSRFHHGHETYNGFRLVVPEKGGPTEIQEVTASGEVLEAPFDLSLKKNVVGAIFVMVLMVWVFVSVAQRYKKAPNQAPKGLQNLLETVIVFVRDDIAKPAIRASKLNRFMPILLTIFFFILFCNLLGLVPIIPAGANLTGNITVTMVLALFTFVITTLSGNKHYWGHAFNTPGVPTFLKLPIPLMPIVAFGYDHKAYCAHDPTFCQYAFGAHDCAGVFQHDLPLWYNECDCGLRGKYLVAHFCGFYDALGCFGLFYPSIRIYNAECNVFWYGYRRA